MCLRPRETLRRIGHFRSYTDHRTQKDDSSKPVTLAAIHVSRVPQRGPGAATKPDQPHRDREGMCTITMLCVCSPMVATLTPCHKIGCKIVHSVQDFQN